MRRLNDTLQDFGKPQMLSEDQIKKQIMRFLKLRHDITFWRQNSGRKGKIRFTSRNGISDIVCVVAPRGRFFGIEVKDAKRKQDDDQITFQEDIERVGGVYLLARSLNDVIQRFEEGI